MRPTWKEIDVKNELINNFVKFMIALVALMLMIAVFK